MHKYIQKDQQDWSLLPKNKNQTLVCACKKAGWDFSPKAIPSIRLKKIKQAKNANHSMRFRDRMIARKHPLLRARSRAIIKR